jgi:hypothetical protein
MIETSQQHDLNYSTGSESHLRMRGTTWSGRANRQHLLFTRYKPLSKSPSFHVLHGGKFFTN